MRFPLLFSPLAIRGAELRNRIFTTGHDTGLVRDNRPTEALAAYHRARARGGAGLIILQATGVHDTARFSDHVLMAHDDTCIPHFRTLAAALHDDGARVFVQLHHPGREMMNRLHGVQRSTIAPSHSPSERNRTVPRVMDRALIAEIIAAYAAAARRMAEAGLDGVELVASHGYLPAQFLSARLNQRDDDYGGSFDNRLRFVAETLDQIRAAVPDGFVVGMRHSGDEHDDAGIDGDESLAIARALSPRLDFLNMIAGTSASSSGAMHIVPSMATEHAYVAPLAQRVREATGIPVFVAGRINQPHEAELILERGQADLCGMTRATIADPDMPNKALAGETDHIRACVGCNQACIGHIQHGLSVSCIQHPETGRELELGQRRRAARPLKVMVVGGGPAGLKAAAVAAERGHHVTLHEKQRYLGGQVRLAQLLPDRAEFGGVVTNLAREAEHHGAVLKRSSPVTRELLDAERPDAVILATGSLPVLPPVEGETERLMLAADVLRHSARPGHNVVIYDWRADWVGMGLALKLAKEGHQVRLAVNGTCAGDALPHSIRDEFNARLHRLGVQVLPWMRLYGMDHRTAYFNHTAAREAVMLEEVDSLVAVYANRQEDSLKADLDAMAIPVRLAGDCLAPRTVEEAVCEGMRAALAL